MFSNVLDPAADRYVRLHFPETETVTFDFIGVPPPVAIRKMLSMDTSCLLTLILPLCLDMLWQAKCQPILLEADEINETVFRRAAAAIQYLTNGQTLEY
jgi:hypothetical protein